MVAGCVDEADEVAGDAAGLGGRREAEIAALGELRGKAARIREKRDNA